MLSTHYTVWVSGCSWTIIASEASWDSQDPSSEPQLKPYVATPLHPLTILVLTICLYKLLLVTALYSRRKKIKEEYLWSESQRRLLVSVTGVQVEGTSEGRDRVIEIHNQCSKD